LTETDAVLEEVGRWQSRPLDPLYPLVFFEALRVITEIKSRGVNDILIAIVDGLKGFPETINAAFAETQIHLPCRRYGSRRRTRHARRSAWSTRVSAGQQTAVVDTAKRS